MILGRYKQQPGERRKRGVDYREFLEPNEEISQVSVVVTPVTDTPLMVPLVVIDPNGKRFAYFVEGGEHGVEYKAEFTVTTSGSQILENEIIFEVEDD